MAQADPQTRHDAAALAQPAKAAGAALGAFFQIAKLWQLTPAQAQTLLGVSRATYFNWLKKPPAMLPRDTLERLSYLLGIYKALQILIPDEAVADAWLRQPNQAMLFGGRSALERMLSGNVADLYVVREYLDAERGGP
ncbi:MAG: MbcA/ParS/Xre antitoxin family protein [Steroidobacteraceae bacterium]